MRGRLVRTLFRGNQILGYHTMDWNGTDGQGRPVSAGSYIYTIQVGNEVKTKKMTLLK
jgi:flagellar hook assembly protein FlgD